MITDEKENDSQCGLIVEQASSFVLLVVVVVVQYFRGISELCDNTLIQ